ncbi:hypothetical protein FIBSPDRAFT_943159 [Athelia psychrophila]|uniref:Uncharacterized protein n=1 Tax=Athelia psychrophila TaxID=1759441 RepID=A0A166WTN6_9AGAM|nr:hypothetical protein FIBSPDRAFT_943159 [Fibularhizoctonia sp. CBS 109695]
MSLFKSLTNTSIVTNTTNGDGTNAPEKTAAAIGATALIQSLLEITAFDACTKKRNAFTTLSVISNARDLCKNIHTRIEAVDNSGLGEWGAFKEYTAAIDPLEELLFKLVDWLEKESDKFLNEYTTIGETITFVNVWEENRTELKTCYSDSEALQTGASGTSLAYADLQKYDDRCLISALCEEISETRFEGPKLLAKDAKAATPSATLIKQLAKVAHGIPAKIPPSIDQPSMTLAAKCAMIVQGALHLGDNATDHDTKIAFSASLVWVKALSLLKNLSTHASKPAELVFDEIQKEYEEFLVFLQNMVAEIPAEYLDIKLSVKNIKRPYYARTVELAQQCHKLVKYFVKAKKSSDLLHSLEGALKAAIDALEATTSAMGILALLEYKDENPEGVADAMDKFAEAEKRVKACFETYTMTADASGLSAKMKAALEKDKAKVTKMRERFAKTKKQGKVPDSIDKEATFTAVLWSTLPAADAASITEWRLELGESPNVKQISLHTQVKDIIDEVGALRFVKGPLVPPVQVDGA